MHCPENQGQNFASASSYGSFRTLPYLTLLASGTSKHPCMYTACAKPVFMRHQCNLCPTPCMFCCTLLMVMCRIVRQTLETLGLECGALTAAVRERVLDHVGRDLSRAINWIMENPQTIDTWLVQPPQVGRHPSQKSPSPRHTFLLIVSYPAVWYSKDLPSDSSGDADLITVNFPQQPDPPTSPPSAAPAQSSLAQASLYRCLC